MLKVAREEEPTARRAGVAGTIYPDHGVQGSSLTYLILSHLMPRTMSGYNTEPDGRHNVADYD